MAIVNSSKIQTGLPQFPDGIPSELQPAFIQIYNAIQNLSKAVSLYAGVDQQPSDWWSQLTLDDSLFAQNMNRVYLKCNEAIPYGGMVSPILVGTELQMRLANATNNTRFAVGMCSTENGKAAGEFAEFMMGYGLVTGIIGMTTGARYWLNTVNGQIVAAPAVGAGNIEQYIGWAMSPSRLFMSISGNFIQH